MEWQHFSSDDSEEENLMEETARITANYLIERTQRTRGLIRRSPLERDREGANETLFRHYFSPEPVYDEAHFRRRFRMSRQLFMRISNDLAEMYTFFQQKPDARGRPGFTPIQKCTAALRQLAYGISSDALDEYLEMSEKIARDSLHYFCQGGGFASGTIDLGGLQVSHVTTFNKIWATNEGGPDNVGASFYDPIAIPQGFSSLGSYVQPNNIPLFCHVLVGKDTSSDPLKPTLKSPIDYTLLWSSESLDIKKDGEGYIWLPFPPDGYKAVGYVVSGSSVKPPLDKVSCVRADFTDTTDNTTVVLENENDFYLNGLNAYHYVGGFVVGNGSVVNLKGSLLNSMPNLNQIKALIQTYSPVIYFHPDEQYLPSSVDWFFENGALLYHKGDESKPNGVDKNGVNLPQGGSNDDTYWLDLPLDGSSKDRVKKGNLQDSRAYFHVKPVSGGLFTDIAIWVFYPFNGGSRAKVKFLNLSLGKLGEHVGDWEHVTLRISNINGELNSVFFSQHSWGKWVSASALEYHTGNKPVVYASLHGHASYPKPGCVLLGSGGSDIGIRDDTAKSDKVMDTGVGAVVMAAEYLSAGMVVEPPWLNYERKWGPKIDYDVDKELKKVKSVLMWRLKKAFERLVETVPREMLGEDGPTGPKAKTSWSGDESV